MARLRSDPGGGGAGFWDRKAEDHEGPVRVEGSGHPFVVEVRRHVDAGTTLIDVGAGSGRIALALAPHVRRVIAVDQSRGMLDLLETGARRRGITNVETVHAPWERTERSADVAICSYVMPSVADIVPFARRLDSAARSRVLVEMGALDGGFELHPLWRYFHGAPRAPQVTYLDALQVLIGLGIAPEADVVELPGRPWFPDVSAAASHYLEVLLLAEHQRGELERLLARWLQRWGDGLRPPVSRRPSAILSWAPRAGEHVP